MNNRWLIELYNASLHLYPAQFQSEFGEEMRAIFSQALQDAAHGGAFAPWRLFLNELVGLPAGLVSAHCGAYRRRAAHGVQSLQRSPLESPWRELLLALAVFLLPAVIISVNRVTETHGSTGLPGMALFILVMAAVGWLGGFPLWSLPYVSLILAVAGYLYVFQWVAGLAGPALISNFSPGVWDQNTVLLLRIASTGMVWLMLFCLTLLVVALLAVFNRFQPLWARFQRDWTLLSYILYGESVFTLLLLSGSYHAELNYTLASLICLAAGIWLYLRSPGRGQRLLALLSCLTLSVGVIAVGEWPFSQGWPSWSLLQPSGAGRLLLSWVWMVLALLLPGLLSGLPGTRRRGPHARPPVGQLPAGSSPG